MIFSMGQLIFMLLTPVSHIGASLFFAKPRFGKVVTTVIWLLYGLLMLALPTSMPTGNFFLTFSIHLVLFFATTTGGMQEKGFLFFSYANIYTCFSTIFTIINARLQSDLMKTVFAFGLIALMQVLLYAVLLPTFRKVTPYLHSGWAKFYAVVLGFFVLIVAQAAFPVTSAMADKEVIVFLLTTLAFCITYVSVFASMKNMVELTREKQKQTHAELLLAQV